MNITKPFTFYVTPSHGYLRVPLSLIDQSHYSQYSYVGHKYAYLEEDCDAGKFMRNFESILGFKPRLKIVQSVSFDTRRASKLLNRMGSVS